jgi:hypothetical protein
MHPVWRRSILALMVVSSSLLVISPSWRELLELFLLVLLVLNLESKLQAWA